jgi:enamine deaminase RidA (YjgF/YER057c/UK114 family)
MINRSTRLLALLLFTSTVLTATAAEIMPQGERIKGRSYSPAVVTEGGRTIWLAGESAITDLEGNDIKGDFEAQARTIFALINQTLEQAGSGLGDVVMMTVYHTDPRNMGTFSQVRKEMFPDGNYPTSTQIAVSHLAVPGMQLEIQAIAVVGDKCSSEHHPCLPKSP